jgi:hypothetical protein
MQLPPLFYTEGWEDVFTADDAQELRDILERLCQETQTALPGEVWIETDELQRRWQCVVEGIAAFAISDEDRRAMTASENIETALRTIEATLDEGEWLEQGVSLLIVDLEGGRSPKIFDIRDPLNPSDFEE